MAASCMFGQAVKAGGGEYKVIFVGDSGVGKTSIINKMYDLESTNASFPTVAAAYAKFKYKLSDGSLTTFGFWDTAGQEKYRAVCMNYYRGANVAIIVCDATNEESRRNVTLHLNDVNYCNPELPLENIIVVLNKIDLVEKADKSCLNELPTAVGSRIRHFMPVSAITGENIDLLLERMAEIAHNTVQAPQNMLTVDLELTDEKPSKKACC